MPEPCNFLHIIWLRDQKHRRNIRVISFWIPLFVESHVHDLCSCLWIPLSEKCLLFQPWRGMRHGEEGTEPLSQVITSSLSANTVICYGSALAWKNILRRFYLLTVQCLNDSKWKRTEHTHIHTHTHTTHISHLLKMSLMFSSCA